MNCLFAKACSTNAGAKLLKLRPLLREQQLILFKATYSKSEHLGSYPKSGKFNKLYKIICQLSYLIIVS